MTEVLHPPVERIVQKGMSREADILLVCVVSVVFVADTVVSAKAAFDMAKLLETMGKIRNELENIQVQIALLKKETSDYMEDKVDEFRMKEMNAREQGAEKIAAVKESIVSQLEKLKELDVRKAELTLNREKMMRGMNFMQKGLLRGNPTASSGKFEKSLKELKDKFIKQN